MIINRYGKAESRLGRKMAHFTVTGSSFNDLADKMDMIGITEHNIKRSGAYTIIVIIIIIIIIINTFIITKGVKVGIIMGSDSDLPTMQVLLSLSPSLLSLLLLQLLSGCRKGS